MPVRISLEIEHQPEQWELSEKLQSLVGRRLATRSHVWQSLWTHIAKHNLQSPKDPSMISCDPLLKVFSQPYGITVIHRCMHSARVHGQPLCPILL